MFVTEGAERGNATNPYFEPHKYVYIYISNTYTQNVHTYLDTYICGNMYVYIHIHFTSVSRNLGPFGQIGNTLGFRSNGATIDFSTASVPRSCKRDKTAPVCVTLVTFQLQACVHISIN